ncbi:fatty acid synthase-like [Bacillus rossius redtenbacheri]|uniref:fatty acid synthase-like n=1 Tax=Bacillus rossius redtenbacheri TaxID=93214 RepID=UPI002FDCC01C
MAPQQKATVVEDSIPANIRAGMKLASPPAGEEVVMSGIAGYFPDSDSVRHFRDNLLGKVDMVTDDTRRWKLEHPEIPHRHGKINNVMKFDASFFGIHLKQAETMDPMCRLILERCYEAVVDAGINPYSLRGSRVGVFVGACFSETEKTWFYEKLQINGYALTGCSRVMLANRISYWLGVNGPSYAVDSACSSSLYALEHAYKSIRNGHCDAAIVGGCNLCLHPFVTLQFSRLGVLSMDGVCRSFDNKANGYARSEAIAVVYLQKAKDAKRIYCTVVHAKTNCDGYKDEGITYPSGLMQQKLLEDFYAECRVDPSTLGYIEAHGTGTKVGDPEELNAIDKVFCNGRSVPLPIGSVKSNIGHSEPASGLCSVAKVVIAFEEGLIPPNLHFETVREGVEALETGRLQVVADPQRLEHGLVGINSFGFGGANCHVLLRWNEKTKVNGSAPADSLPRLVVASGRSEEAVLTILHDVESRPVDVEYVKLLHDLHSSNIHGHMYRGFVVVGAGKLKPQVDVKYFPEKRPLWLVFSGMNSEWPGLALYGDYVVTVCCAYFPEKRPLWLVFSGMNSEWPGLALYGDCVVTVCCAYFPEKRPLWLVFSGMNSEWPGLALYGDCVVTVCCAYFPEKRPLWLVFSGMNSEWPGMGKSLLELPVFAASVARLQKVLKPKGVDVVSLLQEGDSKMFDHCLLSIVAITAMQVGLVDVLRKLGLSADGMLGYSTGEIACAYAKGLVSADQAILLAHACGLAHVESVQLKGATAQVELGEAEVRQLLPLGVDVVSCELGEAEVRQLLPLGVDVVSCELGEAEVRQLLPPGVEVVSCELGEAEVRQLLPPGVEVVSCELGEAEVRQLLPPGVEVVSCVNLVPAELGEAEVRQLLPPGVEVVSCGAASSCAVCGSVADVERCVAELRRSGVVATDPRPTNNLFHHSHFSERASVKLHSLFKQVLGSGARLSTEQLAGMLCQPVRLEDLASRVPRGAVLLEVAPHATLQAALEPALHRSCVSLALADRSQPHGVLHSLLSAVGSLYEYGAQPQLADIYPAVKYPVSRGTPMISHLVKWDHSQDWFVTSYELQEKAETGERTVPINIAEENYAFHSGHVIDGRNLFAATGYLVLVWESLAIMTGQFIKDVPIVFENIRFHRATNIPKEGTFEFVISIQKCSGNFEIVEGGVAIVTGRCYVPKAPSEEMADLEAPEPVDAGLIELSRRDVYKELRLRGYNYSGLFRSIISADNLGKSGKIQWHNNWVAFMDNMLQMQILHADTRGLFVPTSIDKLVVDPKRHLQEIQKEDEVEYCPVSVYHEVGLISSGGIQLKGLKASGISRRKPLGEPVLEKYLFLPHHGIPEPPLSVAQVLRMCVHLVLENQAGIKVKVVEVAEFEDDKPVNLLANEVAAILGDLPLIQPDITVVTPPGKGELEDLSSNIHVEDRQLAGQQGCLLLIASHVLGQKEFLEKAVGALSPKGCIVAREKLDAAPAVADPSLKVVLDLCVEGERLVMLKKVTEMPILAVIPIKSDSFSWVPEMQKAMKESNNTQRIILVSEQDPLSGLLGLVNCIRKEPGGEAIRGVLILDPEAPPFSLDEPLYSAELAKDLAMSVYHEGRWGSFRHLPLAELSTVSCAHAMVNVETRGDLSSLKWFQGSLDEHGNPKKPDLSLIHIYYSALNFRDIMTATGKITAEVVSVGRLNQECVQGLEFSGRDLSGRRVMGMVASDAFATMVYADPKLLWEVPDSWTLEDATTVPVVYGTALFSLFLNGRLQRGESVLIHAGSGGVGQAAINLALHAGCVVFTTVGTPEKRNFIKERFPQLTDRHIGNSRDTSFEQLIMEETEGRGVDMVLNSLAEEKLQASVRCLAPGGRFLEIGKFDLSSNNPLGMEMFLKGTSFHGVTLEKLFYTQHEWKNELHTMMTNGIQNGSIKPLTRTTFQSDEVEPAFRYMAAGKHIGKVLIKVRPEEEERTAVPRPIFVQAKPKFFCSPEKSYIVAGGLGGFGLELVDWLVMRGARRVLLTSRSGVRTGYQCTRARIWRSYGVQLRVSTADICTAEGAERVIREATELGPVSAIFNLAVVLHDAIFENQTEEMFAKSAGPKSAATRHLDRLSRQLCPQLDRFVVFSSVSCGRGNAGQSNYGWSNAVMERVCEARARDGLPALAVQWGAIGEVGLVAEMQEEQHELVIGGTLQQKISSCLEVLDRFLRQPLPVVASMVVAEKRAGSGGSGGIVDCVANIMGIRDLKTVSLHSSLAELGMDSMMAVEIKQSLERDFEVFLTPQDVRGMTFARLAEIASAAAAAAGDSEAPTSEVIPAPNAEFMNIGLMMSVMGDEASARLPVMELPSAVDPADASAPLVIMLPGIEGMASVLLPLAANLTSRTISLQLKHDNFPESIAQLAEELLPIVKENLPADGPFNIIGYSFGGVVAMDIVSMLEAEGHRGKFVLIDSSPDYLQELSKKQIQMDSDDIMQINLLMTIVNVLAPQPIATFRQIKSDLEKIDTWKERLEFFLALAANQNIVHSKDYLFSISTSLYARIKCIMDYTYNATKPKIDSETILLKPDTSGHVTEEDYGLSKHCKDVKVYDVEGSHRTLLEQKETADIINKFFVRK